MVQNKKVLFVSHCLFNQNILPPEMVKHEGIAKDLLDLFAEARIGVIQVACPQLAFNGLDQKICLKDKCDTPKYRKTCHLISKNLINQIKMYKEKNYEIVGFLGIEHTASCAVNRTRNGNRSVPGKGVFIEELEKEMNKKNFQIPLVGVNLSNMYSSMEKLRKLVLYS